VLFVDVNWPAAQVAQAWSLLVVLCPSATNWPAAHAGVGYALATHTDPVYVVLALHDGGKLLPPAAPGLSKRLQCDGAAAKAPAGQTTHMLSSCVQLVPCTQK